MKSFVLSLLAVILFLPYSGQGQQQINDCGDAQVVCTSDDLAFNPDGPGQDDFDDPDNHPGCMTALEQNSAWYYFQIDPNAPPDLVLGFIIHPKGGLGEDYDWALFGPDVVCGDLGFPIRCSSSSAACGFCPETGMGMGTTDVSEGPGTGDGFVMTLVVQPGQGYYLLIDNWQGTDHGFVLTWTDSAAPYLNCAAEPPCALNAIAGPDITACEGDPSVALNGESTGNHGNETYSWSGTNGGTAFLDDPNIQNPTATLPAGFNGVITYTLTVTEDTCVNEDNLNLTVYALPTINITQIGPLCENNPPQALSATPPGGTWSGANTGNTFNPMTNGPGTFTVTYTYTDNHSCTNSDYMDIEVNEVPDVEINPDPAEFCQSAGSVQLTATGSGGASGYTYNWNTPTGTGSGSVYSATVAGNHNVTVTDANGCANTSTVAVVVHPNPIVEIIEPGPICESDDYFLLTAAPSGGAFSGSIVSPSGEIYPNMVTPGTYPITYTYTDANDCDGTDVKNITIVATPNAIADNNGPLCGGEPVLLFGDTDGTGTTITYQWSGPNGYTSNMQNPTNATLGGAYILVVYADGCPSPPAVTNMSVTTTPDALALNDGPYCNGQSIQLLGSTSTTGNVITYDWTGPNGYTSNAQNPTDATAPGTYSLVITVDQCPSAVTQTVVTFNPPPNAMATNTGPYCQGDAITLSGNTSTTGNVITYNWTGPNGYQSSLQNPTDATSPGIYQLVVGVDGCLSAMVPTTVTINSLPQPVITGQDAFCTGFSAIIDAGAGYAAYVWDDASTNQTLSVSSTGIYHVTVTDANGCKANTSFGVTEMASLSPVITGALAFCEGGSTTLDAGPGYATYQWSTGEVSQTIQVNSNGNFGVLITDADGCSGSTNVTTTVHPNPNVTIGGSTTYCIGGFTTLDAGNGYANYAWSNSATTQIITVTSPGNFSVDVIDNFGCAGSGAVTVSESTSLSPVITGINAFCENGSTTLNAGSGFATYLWSDGSMAQNLLVTTTGTYSVSVSDGQGCFGDTSITVSEVLPPSAQLQPSASLCNTTAGGSVINLYDLVLSGDMSGTWEDVDHSGAVGLFTNLNFNNIPAGNYHFIYTTNSAVAPCPESTYQTIINVLDCTCPDVFFFNAAPLCNAGDNLDLTTIENTTEPGMWSILQTPPGANPATLNGTVFDATNGDPGSYTLQYILQNQPPPGCPVNYQVMVGVDPSVDAGIALQPVSYCANENQLVTLSSLITGEDPNGTWTETSGVHSQGGAFDAANGTFKTNNQFPGTYNFQYALNSIGVCPDDASTVTVMIHPLPTAVADATETLDCSHATQQLNAAGSSTGPDYTILWTGPGIVVDGNENTLSPTVDQAGTYQLTITNKLTGCINTTAVTVIANTDAPTDALLTSKDPSCFGDQDGFIQVDQVIGGVSPYLYSLNNGVFSSTHVYNNLAPADYTLAIQDVNGCKWDTLISIIAPAPFSISLGPDIELGLGEHATVQAVTDLPLNQMDTIIWSPDNAIECIDAVCLEANVLAANTVTLTATITDLNGCKSSDQIQIVVSKDRRLYIPNAFSPNGDGINDIFFVSGDLDQIVKIRKLAVFSRWGEAVYQATDFQPNDSGHGWDGRFNNELMNPNVYLYTVEVEYIDGVVEVRTGDVTLLK